jgi:hypothetical protein
MRPLILSTDKCFNTDVLKYSSECVVRNFYFLKAESTRHEQFREKAAYKRIYSEH